MSRYVYLSITPEALIGSMLPPAQFGLYMATGTKKCNRSQFIFFTLDYDQVRSMFNNEYLGERCIGKADGSPKSTVYLSIYRVLEFIPLSAIRDLYLTSDQGITLKLGRATYDKSKMKKKEMHLYQELCPVSSQVASSLPPHKFLKTLTDGTLPLRLPKMFFAELRIEDLADNPFYGDEKYLPYGAVSHLRDCLDIIRNEENKQMKTVQRFHTGKLYYQTIDTGFYIGSRDNIAYYPFPSMKELEKNHNEFFRTI
ncbi:MAG TPA: hypothetical protein VMT63_00435 [Bacteroidales bacterium]|nr:hypothetical protein [Bacteroidales bacterium]